MGVVLLWLESCKCLALDQHNRSDDRNCTKNDCVTEKSLQKILQGSIRYTLFASFK